MTNPEPKKNYVSKQATDLVKRIIDGYEEVKIETDLVAIWSLIKKNQKDSQRNERLFNCIDEVYQCLKILENDNTIHSRAVTPKLSDKEATYFLKIVYETTAARIKRLSFTVDIPIKSKYFYEQN